MESDVIRIRGNVRADNISPVLTDLYLYIDDDEMVFEVNYTDYDGDEGTVLLYIDDNPAEEMRTGDFDPTEGQYYYTRISESKIDDYTEFYLTADDNNGSVITLKDSYNQPFLVGDFDGWGEHPVLSAPDVYFDGDDWVFNVTYWDPDGDETEDLWLNIEGQDSVSMYTDDPDPLKGQVFVSYVLESKVDETTEFYFTVVDVNGSYAELYDDNWEYFVVGDFLGSDGSGNGGTNGDGGDGDDGGSGLDFSGLGRWGDPEVVVAIIALVGMGIGSGVGVWLRKKKRKRFSDLLSRIDDVYSSYKTHPRKCETELEKLKAEIDQDLKQSVIDENNYSILKDRINEVTQEIRRETVRAKIGDLPKDIELRIKDMLIDGKISKGEYNKFMKALQGSTMKSSDKKEMERLMETWMKEDKIKIKK